MAENITGAPTAPVLASPLTAGTTAGGDSMVFVKVRETYDLHTVRNKMSVICIHTPDPEIVRRNWSGLLMNCKFYRPVGADVRLACASVLPADIQSVGITEGDVAPEDLFNPILYKACTNESFSLLESRIMKMNNFGTSSLDTGEVAGSTARVQNQTVTPYEDDFNVYYGLLSDAHGWRHAMPQSGLAMDNLKPLVHEVLASFGSGVQDSTNPNFGVYSPEDAVDNNAALLLTPKFMRGNAKPMPRMPTTIFPSRNTEVDPGFVDTNKNSQTVVPYLRTVVGAIIVPPSRLHELYYRMVVEWTIEFSEIRTLSEIAGWAALNSLGDTTHFKSYDYGESKVLTETAGLASANVDIEKVM